MIIVSPKFFVALKGNIKVCNKKEYRKKFTMKKK